MSSSPTGALDPELVNDWSSEFATVHHHEVLVDAGHQYGIPSLCIDRAQVRKHNHVFSNIIPLEGKATSQKSSGRCWIFAALNVFRLPLIAKLGLPDSFEFSQNYVFFWDKLEKCNYFLETAIATIDSEKEGPAGRLWKHMLSAPIIDGGQWDMLTSVIEKHGLVPKTAYPDSHDASSSRPLNWLINNKLRETMAYFWGLLKQTEQESSSVDFDVLRKQLRLRKVEVLCQIHKALSFYLGPIPTTFDWVPVDAKTHAYIENPFENQVFTPHTFYETVVVGFGMGLNWDAFVVYQQRKMGRKLAEFLRKKNGSKSTKSENANKVEKIEKTDKNEKDQNDKDDKEDKEDKNDPSPSPSPCGHSEEQRGEKAPLPRDISDPPRGQTLKVDGKSDAKDEAPSASSSSSSAEKSPNKDADSIWGSPEWLKGRSVTSPSEWISFINDPRNEYNRTYTVQHLGSVWGGRPILYVNVDQATLHTLAHTSIGGCAAATWFGCDAGKYGDRDKGIWDHEIFKYSRTLGTNMGMVNSDGQTYVDSSTRQDIVHNSTRVDGKQYEEYSPLDQFVFDKKQRLLFGESLMTHAMVFTGVDVDPITKDVTRYRVENSWGTEKGNSGYYSITKEWFDEFVYQVVIPKEFIPDTLQIPIEEILKQKPIQLPLWDPMGALATKTL